jgi:hypothetical protein
MSNTTDTIAILRKTAVLLEGEGAPVCRVDALNSAADRMAKMERVMEMARLLCANLEHGGVGHMTIVNKLREMDDLVA